MKSLRRSIRIFFQLSSLIFISNHALATNPRTSIALPQTPACMEFAKYATKNTATKEGFQSDQIYILKEGSPIFAWNDGNYTDDSLHYWWSASKTMTATLTGAAIQQKRLTPKGAPITVETSITDFFDKKEIKQWQKYFGKNFSKFSSIQIKHFLMMATNWVWEESYESDPKTSTFLPMLYGKGHQNMLRFALSQPFDKYGVGKRWNYSGGNSVILIALLSRLQGLNTDNLLAELLFKDLEIKQAMYERDGSGHLVGSSYFHASPKEMAIIGQLYLQDGIWNGKRLLPEGWTSEAQKVTEAHNHASLLSPEEKAKLAKYVKTEGVFSNRSFWLNQDVPQVNMKHEFPRSPRDLYFAAGHYGQLLLILPTQKMVIARTGHDPSYWEKIDDFVSRAVSCFTPSEAYSTKSSLSSLPTQARKP